ncbi:D-aminoacyl-tRNA deacylase [Salarchaeum sp. JOR-1]|uniref:D-aminoacyl-tRNA deacylase n=1 Tax=Salarchaeum sp. JOR-1 TaxID=2599399 RepID=UPI00119844A6|nr:D-aminoacyl-tRNA deacylase [Salarchaeum sp. JOR-1]QDX39697.1 D-tyrosyl-tRNA(Tyr) deacylase [Salarchaeum sp. JOR-1]
MIGVVVSRADEASVAIGEQLRDIADWTNAGGAWHRDGFELREFEDWHVELDGVAAAFSDPDLVVFASRHSGDTGPLLTAHHTGNFGPGEFGGEDYALAEAAPEAHRALLDGFREHAPDEYEVGMECTHHGPTEVGAPSLFAELGSSEDEWRDDAAARAVARAILDMSGVEPQGGRSLVGFGGGHYVPRPTRIVADTEWGFGHVAAEWCLDDMGAPGEHRDTIDRAFAATDTEYAVVDGEKPGLETTIDDLGYRVVSETWVRETDGVPLDLVRALEDEFASVDDGLRFGENASGEYVIVDLPDDLWADAHSVNAERARRIARETTVAYETTENGNRVEGRSAFPDREAYDEYVQRLADLLREKYDAVEVEPDEVVVTDVAFDPDLAQDAGVPEGPKFGRLAGGQPVEVDGETVTPGDVSREQTARYRV